MAERDLTVTTCRGAVLVVSPMPREDLVRCLEDVAYQIRRQLQEARSETAREARMREVAAAVWALCSSPEITLEEMARCLDEIRVDAEARLAATFRMLDDLRKSSKEL